MHEAGARYVKKAGAVFGLKYDAVWCPKYRLPVLTGDGKWFVVFHVEVKTAEQRADETVGIDVGLRSLVALLTGETMCRQGTERSQRFDDSVLYLAYQLVVIPTKAAARIYYPSRYRIAVTMGPGTSDGSDGRLKQSARSETPRHSAFAP
jgi:hypothetical protein